MKKWGVCFVLTFCWIIGTIGLILLIQVPQNSSRSFEIVKLLFLSIGGYGVVMATYFNIYNSLENTQYIKDQINFTKTENSFRFMERWDSPSLKQARDFTREVKKERSKISDDELRNRILNDKELERSVITAFNYWEEIYMSIQHKRVNEDVLKKAFDSTYCDMYDRFKVWIDSYEKNDPEGYTQLANLYRLWSK